MDPGAVPVKPIMPVPIIGRCVMPKPLARLPRLPVLGSPGSPVLDPSDRAASLDPVDVSGLSTSIAPDTSAVAAPLLWRRWRFDATAMVRGMGAAPGPGALFSGAAAMGTTPFPPTAAPVDPALP